MNFGDGDPNINTFRSICQFYLIGEFVAISKRICDALHGSSILTPQPCYKEIIYDWQKYFCKEHDGIDSRKFNFKIGQLWELFSEKYILFDNEETWICVWGSMKRPKMDLTSFQIMRRSFRFFFLFLCGKTETSSLKHPVESSVNSNHSCYF